VICDDNAQEMEKGVAYKNNRSSAPVVNITSASRNKNFEKLFIELAVSQKMNAGLSRLLKYIF
jgi:hypothetical protein